MKYVCIEAVKCIKQLLTKFKEEKLQYNNNTWLQYPVFKNRYIIQEENQLINRGLEQHC